MTTPFLYVWEIKYTVRYGATLQERVSQIHAPTLKEAERMLACNAGVSIDRMTLTGTRVVGWAALEQIK